MKALIFIISLACLPTLAPVACAAGSDSDLTTLKEQVRQMEDALKALRKKIDALETQKTEKPAQEQPTTTVTAGFGKIKLDGLIQIWGLHDSRQSDIFRLRRSELRLSGDINPRFAWTVMVDPAKNLSVNQGPPVSINQRTNILQDVAIFYVLGEDWRLDIGQEKVPLSLEGLQSSAALDTIERALFMTGPRDGGTPGFGDVRDVGLQVVGRYPQTDIQLAFLNGLGDTQNTADLNDQKDFAARVVHRPPSVPGLQLGVSGAGGGGFGPNRLDRTRLGAELLYRKDRYTLKSEYMSGTDQVAAGGPEFDRRGWYVHSGYHLTPVTEVVLRYDFWDPNDSNPEERDVLLGLNHFVLDNNVKLQLNYLRKSFSGGTPSRDVVLFNAQTSW